MSTQPEALRLADERVLNAIRCLRAPTEELLASDNALRRLLAAELRRIHGVNAELLVAAEYAIRRLQADIDDGSRPDQWTMQDIVHKLRSAIQKAGEQA